MRVKWNELQYKGRIIEWKVDDKGKCKAIILGDETPKNVSDTLGKKVRTRVEHSVIHKVKNAVVAKYDELRAIYGNPIKTNDKPLFPQQSASGVHSTETNTINASIAQAEITKKDAASYPVSFFFESAAATTTAPAVSQGEYVDSHPLYITTDAMLIPEGESNSNPEVSFSLLENGIEVYNEAYDTLSANMKQATSLTELGSCKKAFDEMIQRLNEVFEERRLQLEEKNKSDEDTISFTNELPDRPAYSNEYTPPNIEIMTLPPFLTSSPESFSNSSHLLFNNSASNQAKRHRESPEDSNSNLHGVKKEKLEEYLLFKL